MRVVSVIPNPQAFYLPSGPVAVLMIHGFNGSPASIKPWAQGLADLGFSVAAPCLPGHGTTWEDMNNTTWQQWYEEVDKEFTKLKQKHERVFVAGFSMGGALSLRLASIRGSEIEGLILINPAIKDTRLRVKLVPLLKYLVGSIKGSRSDVAAPNPPRHSYLRTPLKAFDSLQKLWALVRQDLYLVDLPLMVGYSINDHVVDPSNSEVIIDNVSSVDIREVVFERSFHNVALDYDLDILIEESKVFINDVLSGEVERSDRGSLDAQFESIISGLSLDESAPTTFLDELEQLDAIEKYPGDNKELPQLSSIQRSALLGVIGGPIYIIAVQILGLDLLGLGPWPGGIALVAGIFAFFYQIKPDADEDGDGSAI
jgi:carboxylesterase